MNKLFPSHKMEIDGFPIDVNHFRNRELEPTELDLIEQYRQQVLSPKWDAFLKKCNRLDSSGQDNLRRQPFTEFVKYLQGRKSRKPEIEQLEHELKQRGFDVQQMWYYVGLLLKDVLNGRCIQQHPLPKDFYSIFDYDNAAQGFDEDKPEKWQFINCLPGKVIPDRVKEVNSVTFDVSRYGKFEHTIRFDNPVTVKTAVEAVEAYMSQPLTKDYYQIIKHDLFHNEEWPKARKWFKTRGDCMTDCRYLEQCTVDSNGHLTFFIGS